jgi:hypothetical protein
VNPAISLRLTVLSHRTAPTPGYPRTLSPIFDTGMRYGFIPAMPALRKITVEVPTDLLEKAQLASGTGVTQTVRAGLQLIAASSSYARLRNLRGKVRFSRKATDLKDDR